ncbi:MAG: mechanosensitive ion channel family protein [Synechococcaceae bacterium WBB_3_034]|jgi:small-conductance mechanosensitive channel|nr:mechanosensitive ion channel family protein [Synechococcaceae bacterium WBB_3_034]NDG23539.1 mechanosensitive ion channel family protein [Synechococcaceae bacterium WBB_10_009]
MAPATILPALALLLGTGLISAALAWRSLPMTFGADQLLMAGVKLVLVVLAVRLANRAATRALRSWSARCGDEAVAALLGSLAPMLRALISAMGAVFYLQNIGVEMAAIWALLSAGGIGAGLALKQPVQEFFNYLTLLLDRPFQVGQWIQVNGITARVERIGVRSTRLRNLSGEAIVMGNSLLTGSVVTNCDELEQRRVVLRFALEAEAPPAALEQLPQRVQRWLADGPGLRLDRCHCLDLKGTALVFELVYALEGSDPQAHREVQQRVALGLNRLIQELGLRLAAS